MIMQDNVVAIIQARMTSTRLPGKILLPLSGAPLLQRMLERVSRITGLDAIWLAIPAGRTTTLSSISCRPALSYLEV